MIADGDCSAHPPGSKTREARRRVVDKLTELILASADALEAEESNAPSPPDLRPLLEDGCGDADPGLIRGFVESPVYKWVTYDYVTGNDSHHVLCKIVEILHEFAPGVFRQPRY
jgi:hypothetical protein